MARIPQSGVQHCLRAGGYEAVVAGVGASLRSLSFEGRDLVVPFDADEVRPAYRGVTLVPWPNRVVDGRYTFDGVEYELALTEPARGHALHGLGSWLCFEAVDKGPSHVTLEGTIEPQSGYPWRVVVSTTFALGADGLTQIVRARNESRTRAPFGTGPHPYLVAGAGPLDEWVLELPADEVLAVTEDRLIPTRRRAVDTDAERFDFRVPRPIGAARIDHAYTGLHRDGDGVATVRLTERSGAGVALSWDRRCGWVQIHTADLPEPGRNRLGLAVEPMTCPPDAFSTGQDLLVLDPEGGEAEAAWTIAAISA